MTAGIRSLTREASGGRQPPELSPHARLVSLFLALVLLALPIFAHGCHTGDHDDEPAFVPPADHNEEPAL